MVCVVIPMVWAASGGASILYLAALKTVPEEIYEAADIDGISWWSRFTRIELPLIASSIYLLLVFAIIETITIAKKNLSIAAIYVLKCQINGKLKIPISAT